MSYGVSVETVLSEPNCRPGGVVAGKVHLAGGGQAADVRHVTIALMPRMNNGYGGETAGPEVYRGALTRAFRLEPGQRRDLSFSIPLPYELPFTTVLGRELPGFTIGLCTEVDVKGAPDPGDIDPISVEPLKSQQWVLAAIARLGFRIQNVAFEQSKLSGVPQQLPFYQEIQLAPPSRYTGRVGEVGLSFVASPRNMAFVLREEGGGAPDGSGRFQAEHPEAAETDWFSKIGQWLEQAASRPRPQASRPSHGPSASFQSPPLPPPGAGPSTYPPPPGHHGMPAPAAAEYGGPGAYGQNAFPPPAPGPGQGRPLPGHAPAPQPGHAPVPPPAHGAPPPAPAAPGQGMPYPPPPAPPGPPPPPAVHHHHGAPPYPRPGVHHRGPGWHAAGAVGAVGGVAAAGIAGGLAAGAAVDAFGNVVGGAANVAGYAAGIPAGQFGDAVAGYAGGLAADAGRAVAGEVANEVAGEAAGVVGEILGGLLGGLFG